MTINPIIENNSKTKMSESITTTQLLDFLVKADKVSTHVTFTKQNGVYDISIHANWDDNNHFYTRTTCVSEDGQVGWELPEQSFLLIDEILDELVKEKEEREMKRQKREELLSRLTDEEKELLGVK